MKKLMILMVSLFCGLYIAKADNERPITLEQMPPKAQQFVRAYFADSRIAMAKMETDFMQKSYDVIFTDGNKVEFDRKGDWTDVDCKFTVVPQEIIPAPIREYVAANYPDATVVKIERDRTDWEIRLSSGWEVKFDTDFRVVDMDND